MTDPQLVEMTASPTASLVLANASTELGIRVRITASELPPARRAALDLALVLDTSGSMEGAAIDALRASARALAAKLRDGDRLAVVVFHSKAEVLVPNVVIRRDNRLAIDRAIAGLHATGTTDLAGGLTAGLAQLRAGYLPDGINRIVLLSDGVPNSSAQLPALVANIRQAGVSITSLGFGIDYDTTLMTQLARDTGGAFHYLATAAEVATVFDAELAKMTTAVARNLQLAIEPGPGVTIAAMPGVVAGPDGKMLAAIGDLPAGEVRDLMIPITVIARGAGSTAELVQVTLTFDDVIGNSGQRTREAFVSDKTSSDPAAIARGVVIKLEVARIRATAAAAILQAIMLARQGQVQPARHGLGTAAAIVKAAAARYPELAELVTQLAELDQELAQIVVAQRVVRDQTPPPSASPIPEAESRLRRAEDHASAVLRGE
ncbi:MAG: VWA domain-containing protein [Kofleriaceae bacterium]